MSFDDLLVPVLEHVDMPTTGHLHQYCVALVRHQIRVTVPFEQYFGTVQMVAGLTTHSPPGLFGNTGLDRGPGGLSPSRANF